MATTKTCGCCNGSKNFTQFYKSPVDGAYTAICKNCCRKKFKQYSQVMGADSAALWVILAEIGVPFLASIWKETETYMLTAGPNTDIIMTYLRYLSESGIQVTGFWDSDKMLDQLIPIVVKREEVKEDTFDAKSEFRKWGKFVTKNNEVDKEAYDYLNNKMEEYTGSLHLKKPAQLNRYRDLCKAELRKIRLEEDPNVQQKDISAATTEILTLMKLLKIDNFQSDSRTDVEKTLEYQAAIIEKKKPAEVEDINKYRDFCGFYELEQSLMRPLRNAVAGTKDYPSLTKGD